MPQLSDFYGLIIWIYWDEDKSKHKEPHIHAEYAGKWAVLSIPEGNVLEADADFPAKKIRMVQTWIDIHPDELMGAWALAMRHLHPTKIRGLDKQEKTAMRTFQQTISARAGDGYDIHVTFADGTGGIFDFSPYMEYPCYEPLRERAFFEKVEASHGTLSWPGEIDIAPEAVWADTVRTV